MTLPTAEQQERFKWRANERADRAEAQVRELRDAFRQLIETYHRDVHGYNYSRSTSCTFATCLLGHAFVEKFKGSGPPEPHISAGEVVGTTTDGAPVTRPENSTEPGPV